MLQSNSPPTVLLFSTELVEQWKDLLVETILVKNLRRNNRKVSERVFHKISLGCEFALHAPCRCPALSVRQVIPKTLEASIFATQHAERGIPICSSSPDLLIPTHPWAQRSKYFILSSITPNCWLSKILLHRTAHPMSTNYGFFSLPVKQHLLMV